MYKANINVINISVMGVL